MIELLTRGLIIFSGFWFLLLPVWLPILVVVAVYGPHERAWRQAMFALANAKTEPGDYYLSERATLAFNQERRMWKIATAIAGVVCLWSIFVVINWHAVGRAM
jgi:ferric-dicitrate binding protein FerR (iron transport regulator)